MLIQANQSCLLLIDVQEKLTPHVLEPGKLVANCSWLIRVAQKLNVPVFVSEQYPKGLSTTVPELRQLLSPEIIVDKVFFSCAADAECLRRINALERNQIVIAGIETHVCVMQTAIELQSQGKEVFVVTDAISSRHEHDMRSALQRMQAAGIHLVTKEMVFFEWLRKAGTEEFKQMSKEFL